MISLKDIEVTKEKNPHDDRLLRFTARLTTSYSLSVPKPRTSSTLGKIEDDAVLYAKLKLFGEIYDDPIERTRKLLDLLIDPGVTINNARFQELVSECRKINERFNSKS